MPREHVNMTFIALGSLLDSSQLHQLTSMERELEQQPIVFFNNLP